LLVVFIALVAARHIEENKYLEDEYENTLADTDDLEEPELEEVPAEEAYITAGRTGGSSGRTGGSSSRTGGSTSRTGGSSTSRTGGSSTSRTGGSSTSRTGGSSTSRTGGTSTSRTGDSSTSRTGGSSTSRTGTTIGGSINIGGRTTYVSRPKVIRFAGQYTFENFEPAGTPLPAGYRSMVYIQK
jgi:hypothetical protein